jgi:hypothetical protein
MFKLTGKAKEDFLNDLELDLPLEKILESMSDYELLMKQMMFFDKMAVVDFQNILKKKIKNYHQGLFGQFIDAIEKANKQYNNS